MVFPLRNDFIMEGENPEINAVPSSLKLTGIFPNLLLCRFQKTTSGVLYPASSYLFLIALMAETLFPSSIASLNSISERIRILVGMLDCGTSCLVACPRIRSKTETRSVLIPQSALLSWLYLSIKDPESFCSSGDSENVMKWSLKSPSFLSEI